MSLNIGAKFSKYTSKSNSKIYQKSYKWSEVAQLCPTLCDPVDCSLPGSSVHWIFQAIVLEWIAISFSRGSSQPRDRTWVSCIVDRRFTVWATREVYIYTSLPGKSGYNWTKKWLLQLLPAELLAQQRKSQLPPLLLSWAQDEGGILSMESVTGKTEWWFYLLWAPLISCQSNVTSKEVPGLGMWW